MTDFKLTLKNASGEAAIVLSATIDQHQGDFDVYVNDKRVDSYQLEKFLKRALELMGGSAPIVEEF